MDCRLSGADRREVHGLYITQVYIFIVFIAIFPAHAEMSIIYDHFYVDGLGLSNRSCHMLSEVTSI